MIRSLEKIEFIPAGGGAAVLLLDHGDAMAGMPAFPLQQADASDTPVGAAWSRGEAMGGAVVQASWTRRADHATHQAAVSHKHTHPAAMPLRVKGILRVTVEDGDVLEYADARILACSVAVLTANVPGKARTLTEYRAALGKMTVASTATFTPPVLEPGTPPQPDPWRPAPLPLLFGAAVSGITTPAEANGSVAVTGEDDGWLVFSDADVTIRKVTGRWRILCSGGRGWDGTAADFPWQVTTWTPYGGAAGAVVVARLDAG